MTPELWRRIESLFESALKLEPGRRAAFLDEACAGDEAVRREVESFLAAHEQAESFNPAAVAAVAADLVAEYQDGAVPGQTFGRYKVLSLLSTGGMGEVYLARDDSLDRPVALKLLPARFTRDQERVRRFVREARAASALNHPNIITIHEIGVAGDVHFIAAEFIDGTTLRRRIAGGRQKLEETLDVAIQVAAALDEAHKAGIVHRDIKPENIMVRPDGLVKVLDFGLAKLTEPENPAGEDRSPTVSAITTLSGVVMGTPGYMSPEQARGSRVDARTDIFSLGVVIYEMITGQAPFGRTMAELFDKELEPLSRLAPDAPVEVEPVVQKALARDCENRYQMERIVAKALEKKAEQRYQTAKDLRIDLKSLKQRLENQPERAHAPSADSPSESTTTVSGRQPAIGTGDERAAVSRGATSKRINSAVAQLIGYVRRHRLACLIMAALLLLAAGAGIYRSVTSGRGEIDSVAILPFQNLGDDPGMQYLSEGIAESLIINLSQLPRLKVMSRFSAFRYRSSDADPREVGRALKVRAVVIGQVRQIGDRLAISLELVDAQDNSQIWGMQYNRRFNDILAVQAEMAAEISVKLRLRLSGEQRQQLTGRYTADYQAYKLYLQGRFYWNKLTKDGMYKSIEYYRQAIGRDPTFALAHAALSYSYLTLGSNYVSPQDVMEQARLHAIRALELDEGLAEAHNSMAAIKYGYDWDWPEAEREYKRTLELNANHAGAYNGYSHLLQIMKRPAEAIARSQQALELDPLSLIANVNLGNTYYYARQQEQAIAAYRKTLDLDSSFFIAHLNIARIYALEGKHVEAMAELDKATAISAGDPLVLAATALVYAKCGKTYEAQSVLNALIQMSTQRYVRPHEVASVYAALGRYDQAIMWLERSFQERSLWILRVNVDPQFDVLRRDQKFIDLLQRIGLPQ